MAQHESEVLALLKEINQKQDRLIERLFGDLDMENPKARFPQLESRAQVHEDRLHSLENDRIRLTTIASIVGSIVGYVLSFIFHPFKH